MKRVELLHHLIDRCAELSPKAPAIKIRNLSWDYETLANEQDAFASAVINRLMPGSRVAIWLSKSIEFVSAAFGAAKAGCVFVPINPVLKAYQVGHIMHDSGATLLLTSFERIKSFESEIARCPSLKVVVLVGDGITPQLHGINVVRWSEFLSSLEFVTPNITINDVAAIFYTSGSTGLPKGVVVPHRSLVTGAGAVSEYLQQCANDRILAAMPLSFDAGFSQLTTSFYVGACCYLLEYFLPAEVVSTIAKEGITGLTGVPPFWVQMVSVKWTEAASRSLRYFATTGGKMSPDILGHIRALAPNAAPYLMYGLTEAFRSTYLDPAQIDRKRGSIGKAIPGQKVYVVRPDGTACDHNEVGELVHIGSTVCLGYWNKPEATAERYKMVKHSCAGVVLEELAVFSGDQAKIDEDGFIYFVGRTDELIKSSGYRISPVEVEEAVRAAGLVDDIVAYGIHDESAGQRVGIIAYSSNETKDLERNIHQVCAEQLPKYMLPSRITVQNEPLPRNPNGKLDRKAIIEKLSQPIIKEEAA